MQIAHPALPYYGEGILVYFEEGCGKSASKASCKNVSGAAVKKAE